MTNVKEYLEFIGMDNVPHGSSNLLEHSERVSKLLLKYGRSKDLQNAGLFHSIHGTEFQQYQLNTRKIDEDHIKSLIGEYAYSLVTTFCTLPDRTNTILYGKGLKDPEKTDLRWLEYCNLIDQYPTPKDVVKCVLREFKMVLRREYDFKHS